MAPRIGVHLIFGQNPEPFLQAALESVAWADYVCAVNTAPGHSQATENQHLVERTVPRDKLRMDWLATHVFDFAEARNRALALADAGDYVLIVDADDVHWPEWEIEARALIGNGFDIAAAHFHHFAVYKDLLHSTPHREILFRNTPGVHFTSRVHEKLWHPREHPALANVRYSHYGYIKPAREVAGRWEFYRSLGSEVHEYDASQPDRALDDWPLVCTRFTGEHPPAVRELLQSYPSAPEGIECAPA